MELLFFLILFVLSTAMVGIGFWKGNPWLISIGGILLVGIGGLVLSQGLTSAKIEQYVIDDTNSFEPVVATPVYSHYPSSLTEIWALGWLSMIGGFLIIVLTFYYAFFAKPPEGDLV
jgi:hypothetical protein